MLPKEAMSTPIAELYPERRILIDWCFAISYNYPYNLTEFYSIPIWPGFANYKAKREVPQLELTDENFYTKYGHNNGNGMHPKDFSAGELYAFLEDTLAGYGYHETCLLRSVCELAQHPFDDNHQHLLSDIVTFVLSPSQHEGFRDDEDVYRKTYELAEQDGFLDTHSSCCDGHQIRMYLTGVHFTGALLSLWSILRPIQAEFPLLFPASSVYQITSSLSVPVVIPDRKLFWDWGLQMNYALPAQPSSFYAATIWPDEFSRRGKRHLWNETAKYLPEGVSAMHPSDFTAGELYESLENMLIQYGFDESCLLRSVCELARHPFKDMENNMLTALLTFTLTPSLHEAFAPGENVYREVYEHAEEQGFLGMDCGHLYSNCPVDFLSGISSLLS
ncbi:GD18294 [Drosophila simulans]|uniref:GD18294 n=2 Tax=Drosophila simulans TaxID=7240 RepID=B4QT58_DROSI|nr:GD18294 [Drosophila simulans]